MEYVLNNYYENGQLLQSSCQTAKKFVSKYVEGKLKIWTSVPRNGKKSNSLTELRSMSIVRRVDVRLQRQLSCSKFILRAIDKIIKTGVFVDWLLLKCEASNIPFQLVNEEINIYSTSSFDSLKHLVNWETCLPLPFIHKESDSSVKYFLLNFNENVNCKCEKLNSRVFFNVNNKEILVSFDVGIILENEYDKRIDSFKIRVGPSLEVYVKQHLTEIKRLIVYNHILWGYLQDWVKNISSNFLVKNGSEMIKYSRKLVAANLTLRKIGINEIRKLNDLNTVYLIASFAEYALYLEFKPVSDINYFTFLVENIETPVISTVSVIQYYRQFFYINDETKSNALKCLLDFSHSKKTFLDLDDVNEYKERDKKLMAEKPLLKTKTVEEINASVEEVNKGQQSEDSIIKLLKSGAIDKEKIKNKLLPFVKESLKQCFENNPTEVMNKDESKDTSLMVHRFQEAVEKADRSGSFQAFLEHVYSSLKWHFTNLTCQKIMECLIYKELENRYSTQNGIIEESVGEKELEQLIGQKEANEGIKRKGETSEDCPIPKMPKLMPLEEFIKQEREKEEGLKYSCKLKSCSVVLGRRVTVNEIERLLKKKQAGGSVEGKSSPRAIPENNLGKGESSPKVVQEKSLDENKSSPKATQDESLDKNESSPNTEKILKKSDGSPKTAQEKSVEKGKSSPEADKILKKSEGSPKATQEKSLDKGKSSPETEKILKKSEESPKASEEKNIDKNRRSPRAILKENLSDENRTNTGTTNFMLKFPRIFLKSKSRIPSTSDTTHSSDDEPVRKTSDFWEEEKLYRECLTSKTLVVINRIEDVVGVPNISNKTVKISKDDKMEIKSEPLSPKNPSNSEEGLVIKEEPKIERRSISVQVEETEITPPKKSAKIESPVKDAEVDTPKKDVGVDTSDKNASEDDLEIIKESIKPKAKITPACGRCNAKFNTFREVEDHERSVHANDKIYRCNYEKCEKKFHGMAYLELHRKTKHEKSLYCNYCDITSRHKDELEIHLMSSEHEQKRISYVEEL